MNLDERRSRENVFSSTLPSGESGSAEAATAVDEKPNAPLRSEQQDKGRKPGKRYIKIAAGASGLSKRELVCCYMLHDARKKQINFLSEFLFVNCLYTHLCIYCSCTGDKLVILALQKKQARKKGEKSCQRISVCLS